ncbi:MAG: pentapeptide repeat-containing protein [Planctomycetota bacterium]
MDDVREWMDETFDGVEHRGERIAGVRYVGCTFTACDFEEAAFVDVAFEECRFERCGLVLARLEGVRFVDVVFEGCKLAGIVFDAETIGRDPLTAFRFVETRLMGCTFANLDVEKAGFRNCVLEECVFTGSRLPQADFRGARFERSSLARCNLAEADFRDAEGLVLDPRENKLDGARFDPAGALQLLAPFGLRIE